ncbi:glutamate receptor ionotropic, delta-2-like [Vespula pensylvanica]|uniref:glutamate receptor ionotropic, delta-2-like n=1 Tax=Vespula pensylvanica TaxID=30213 RepID=UPI001CBA3965|nr:glutamate receptor ionotropic, delta-2-like [Vespula pensylvanica]
MIVRVSLILALLQYIFDNGLAASGLIWDKYQQNFVQLYSIPRFAALNAEVQARRRRPELYEFHREPIRVAYYQDPHVVMFYENNTKIRGISGETWTLLADYLNFTLIPVKSNSNTFGELLKDGTYDGLMGIFKRNETDVILRTGLYRFRKKDMDYTVPIYGTGYNLLIRPKWQYNNMWLIAMFSINTWYFIISLFVILSLFGYYAQKIPGINTKENKIKLNFNLSDHIFHTFAMMCSQGYLPTEYLDKFKILSTSKNIFSWLIFLTFSSHLIYRMTNREVIPPFKDLTDLLSNTNYIVLSFRGSMVYESFEKQIEKLMNDNPKWENRVQFMDDEREIYKTACENEDKYAIFEVHDTFTVISRFVCTLIPVGNLYYKTWISFGMQKYLPYKRTIDVALIKMQEVGLVDCLKERWLLTKLDNKENSPFKKIDFDQTYVIFCILTIGIFAAILVLAIEHIVFFYESKLNTTGKRVKRKTLKALIK